METGYWNLGWSRSISREAGRKPKTRTWELKSERTWSKLELKQDTRKRKLESGLEPSNRTRDRLETRNRKLRIARSKSKPESEIGNQKPESRLEPSNQTRGQRATRNNRKRESGPARGNRTRAWAENGNRKSRSPNRNMKPETRNKNPGWSQAIAREAGQKLEIE